MHNILHISPSHIFSSCSQWTATVELPLSKALNLQLLQWSSSPVSCGRVGECWVDLKWKRHSHSLPLWVGSRSLPSPPFIHASAHERRRTNTPLWCSPLQTSLAFCQLPLAFLSPPPPPRSPPPSIFALVLLRDQHASLAGALLSVQRAAEESGEKARWLTEIRPLIRSSDWGLWKGLCSPGRQRQRRILGAQPLCN